MPRQLCRQCRFWVPDTELQRVDGELWCVRCRRHSQHDEEGRSAPAEAADPWHEPGRVATFLAGLRGRR